MDRLGHWRFRAWWTQLPCSMWPLRLILVDQAAEPVAS